MEPHRCVTVFGSSSARPGEPLWDVAEDLGRQLALAGFKVINGGYTGTMEASSKGAREAGGRVEGVVVSSLFPSRSHGNHYLTDITDTPSLVARLDKLTDRSDVFVVLPGQLGTAAELFLAWNLAWLLPLAATPEGATSPAAGCRRPLVVCFRQPWQGVVEALGRALELRESVMRHVVFVDDAAEALQHCLRHGQGPAPGSAP
eukprot:tig00000342_g24220.t1